jgi:hypothetical protein
MADVLKEQLLEAISATEVGGDTADVNAWEHPLSAAVETFPRGGQGSHI